MRSRPRSRTTSRRGSRCGAPRRAAVVAVAAASALVLAGCSGEDEEPAADPAPATSTAPEPAPAAPEQAVVATDVGVGIVAGRMGSRKRAAVKAEVTAVVDRYLDGAYVAGPWPRTDFAAAFVDFRPGVAADASGRDLDLVTLHDVGAGVGAVTVTRRRLAIDVLAPRGEVGAVTAHVELGLALTPLDPAAGGPTATTVTGSLYLTRSGDAWKVFGYDVQEETG